MQADFNRNFSIPNRLHNIPTIPVLFVELIEPKSSPFEKIFIPT